MSSVRLTSVTVSSINFEGFEIRERVRLMNVTLNVYSISRI